MTRLSSAQREALLLALACAFAGGPLVAAALAGAIFKSCAA